MLTVMETVGDWVAVIAYVAASVAITVGVVFRKDAALRAATYGVALGVAAHAIAIIARWVRVGHGPYLGFYEVASLLAFLLAAGFLVFVWRWNGFVAAGMAVLPVAFLVLGGSMLASRDAMEVTGSLASIWLVIHVLFANLAFGSYGASFLLGVGFLMRHSRAGSALATFTERLPDDLAMTQLSLRLVSAGFVFQTAMIASGAVWAERAWGRYWGWDPIETWSLIAWVVYALYLHLTLTLGWRGRRAAWLAVIALPVILFSLLGVPIVYKSIHGAYLAL